MDFALKQTEWVRYDDGDRHPVSRVTTDIRVRAIRDFRDQVRDATFRATLRGKEIAEQMAPQGGPHNPNETSSRKHLKDAIEMATATPFGPGGAGGGGSYQQRLYVDTYMAPHAAYLFTGTGIYGPKRQRIYYGKEIRFFWWRRRMAKRVFSIAGMEPNTDWWEAGKDALEIDLGRRIKRIHVQGVRNANL